MQITAWYNGSMTPWNRSRIETNARLVSAAARTLRLITFQNSRNILVLELNRAVRPANLGHESLTMPEFNVLLPGKIGCEHGEVVGDDCIEFVILPMPPNLRFVSHFVSVPVD